MVRSRSETHLNRIFLDLCTSPELRSKYGNTRKVQREYNPPLPTLQPIKSVSCTNLTQILQNNTRLPVTDDAETEALDLTVPLPPRKRSITHTPPITTPLIPMESTGFLVETPRLTNRSATLFETTLLNSVVHANKKVSFLERKHSPTENTVSNEKQSSSFVAKCPLLQNTSNEKQSSSSLVACPVLQNTSPNEKKLKLTSLIAAPSTDKKHQDYTSRLRDRLKARKHLRTFFLS